VVDSAAAGLSSRVGGRRGNRAAARREVPWAGDDLWIIASQA